MSKLHVTQIAGYLRSNLAAGIDMSDCVAHKGEQLESVFLTRALAVLAIGLLTQDAIDGLATTVTDGENDGGIDAIYFDPKENTLYLVQTKWHHDGHGSIEVGDALKFIEGVKNVLDDDLSSLNQKIKNKSGDIHRAIFDANAKFALVVAHTGQEALATPVEEVFRKYVESQNDTSELMSFHVLNQSDLHKAVAAGAAGAPISIEVALTNWGQIREPHLGVYGQVSVADVSAWLNQHGGRLFEKNVRQFLGSSLVNQELVATLVNRPDDFWYFNNGITAVANEVKKKPVGGSSTDAGIFECDGFCVVNGAQTVGSIHAACTQNPESASKARVSLRIISIAGSSDQFSTEVTRYTNTQNAIERRDFVALDPEQERIRNELRIEGIEYSYKAGSQAGAGSSRFDLTEATVALACASKDVVLAVQAKREIGRLWEDISKAPYRSLFNAGMSGPVVWSVVQHMRLIDDALQTEAKKRSGRDALICTHGNRMIQWASYRRLEGPADFSEAAVKSVVAQVVGDVIAAVKATFPESYPASLFKNLAKCKLIATKLGL